MSQDIRTRTTDVANSEAIRNGRFSFYAKNLSTGEVLVEHKIDSKMSPASTLKLLTTYAALDILGPEYRFITRIGYAGIISEAGVLVGDIIVEAGGDPALGSEHYAENYGNGSPIERQVAIAIREAGIKRIEGKILFDESIYSGIDIPDEWTWQDMGNYYAAAAHAFTFRENMVKVHFKSGPRSNEKTLISRMDVDLPGVVVDNQIMSADISSDQAFFYTSPYSNTLRMFGRIPLNKKDFEVKGAIPDPAAVFRAELNKALNNVGIQVQNEEVPHPNEKVWDRDVTDLISFESPRLEKLVAYTNMKSNNLYAEHFLRQIGRNKKGVGSFEKGIESLKEWCGTKGVDTNGLRIKDGSGLSRANSVTAKFFVELLNNLASENYYEPFKIGLPVAGRSGSMRRVGKGTALEGKMFAKTGYIEDVRAYCGFLDLDGEIIVFSIMANDYDLSASQMRLKMGGLLELMVK